MTGLPSISQWIETVGNPDGRFRTLGQFEAERDAYGNVKFIAGNSAAVFPVRLDGRPVMLKCYIKEGIGRENIERYIDLSDDPLLPPLSYLRAEAYVFDDLGNGRFHDIALGAWVDGNTLEVEIRRAGLEFGEKRFCRLAQLFDATAIELLGRPWAHGDLKPENIIVTPSGEAVLIDFDAMFIPGSERCHTAEVGTPCYQHPSRDENHYGPYLDDYPAALISVSLHALSLDANLYRKYHKGDGLILRPEEIFAGASAAYTEILHLFAESGEYALYYLALQLLSPSPEIPKIVQKLEACRINQASRELCEKEDVEPLLFEQNGLWGYADENGNSITGAIFEEAHEFREGLATVCICGMWQVIDTRGRMIANCAGFDRLKPFGCGLAPFRKDSKWGYIDKNGSIAIAPRFDRAATMRDNMAVVSLNGKTGFIDINGEMVIYPIFDHACSFRKGHAQVQIEDETFTIDRSGKRV